MQLEVDLARCVRELDDDTWSLVRVEEASTAGVSGDTAGLGACRFEVDEVLHDLRWVRTSDTVRLAARPPDAWSEVEDIVVADGALTITLAGPSSDVRLLARERGAGTTIVVPPTRRPGRFRLAASSLPARDGTWMLYAEDGTARPVRVGAHLAARRSEVSATTGPTMVIVGSICTSPGTAGLAPVCADEGPTWAGTSLAQVAGAAGMLSAARAGAGRRRSG